jgi:cell division protein FtsB
VKVFSVLLVAFLLSIQAQIWFGKGGLSRVVQLESQLGEQRAANDAARVRNAQIEAELLDLREGLEMVEEKARSELDMVRPDEIYVQVMGTRKQPAGAKPIKDRQAATASSAPARPEPALAGAASTAVPAPTAPDAAAPLAKNKP